MVSTAGRLEAILFYRFGDQANSKDGLPGLVQELHLPFGVGFKFSGDTADQVATDPRQFIPGRITVGEFGAVVSGAGVGSISDTKEKKRHASNAGFVGRFRPQKLIQRNRLSGCPNPDRINSGFLRCYACVWFRARNNPLLPWSNAGPHDRTSEEPSPR